LQLFPAYFGIHRAATEEERAGKVSETVAVISQLEAVLANGMPFFAGDSVGYLDIVVGCHLFWLEAFSRMFGVALIDAAQAPEIQIFCLSMFYPKLELQDRNAINTNLLVKLCWPLYLFFFFIRVQSSEKHHLFR
jgi:hypothetical protein